MPLPPGRAGRSLALVAAVAAVASFVSGLLIPDPWRSDARQSLVNSLLLGGLVLGAAALAFGALILLIAVSIEWRLGRGLRAATRESC